jgi:hypothetical protein
MREGSVPKGRNEFVLIIALGAIVFLAIGLVAWFRRGEVNGIGTFGRPVVLVALGLLAYGGRSWARTAATVWMSVIALVLMLNAIPVIGANVGAGVGFFLIGAGFGAAAFRLQTSPHIDTFLAERRRGDSATLAS